MMTNAIEKIKKSAHNFEVINSRINEVSKKAIDPKTTGYIKLFTLLHETRISHALFIHTYTSFTDSIEDFNNYEIEFDKFWYSANPFTNETPKYFVKNGEAINISLSDEFASFLANKFVKNKREFKNYADNPELIKNYGNIQNKIQHCYSILNAKLDDVEILKGDMFDDEYMYSIANKAIAHAYKNGNVNECDLLPSDLRSVVIDIFHRDLGITDTNDIGKLYYIGLERFSRLNDMGDQLLAISEEMTKKRTK